MDLQEQLTAAQTENNLYKQSFEGINAEKFALDQLLVDNLKILLASKKDLILANEKIRQLSIKVDGLVAEKETLQKELDQLKVNEKTPS